MASAHQSIQYFNFWCHNGRWILSHPCIWKFPENGSHFLVGRLFKSVSFSLRHSVYTTLRGGQCTLVSRKAVISIPEYVFNTCQRHLPAFKMSLRHTGVLSSSAFVANSLLKMNMCFFFLICKNLQGFEDGYGSHSPLPRGRKSNSMDSE